MTTARPGRPTAVWVAATAAAGTALCAWVVAPGGVGAAERAVFAAVNGWPDPLRWPLWTFQLLGVLVVPLVVAAGALLLRRWRLAVALVLLVPAKLFVEREVVKALVRRERPGTTIPDAVLRGDVPSAGPSFPSGHAMIAFGVLTLLWPYLPRRWRAVVLACAVLNSVARVYLGAHAPLDVVAGALAGVAVGALLTAAVGTTRRAGV
ncbi:phosphatase PAP2 family protein [Blastococcus sp. PRF04-17]|uniref:phosphatase PAP2 family protein n=1 Tax=Blastococcus sp. PRF04-17 TaxID=2933797 RepID=UPI001FF58EB1|nr:phosphatase PAP2 family protein [Blastococcus sp. PRF04-17]UOY02399.1 phosphatase PAP2 family protein [Blastococcus sp. PRF04-17]